jgi:glycosyltransferase involved in cell wall biosynthesis
MREGGGGPIRVLILHSRYLSGPASGENRVAADEARLLAEAGHRVRVWTPEPRDLHGLGLVRTGLSTIWSSSAAAAVGRVVERERIDIVHVHNLFPTLSPAVLRRARSAGAAVVMTLHNYRLMCLPANFLRDGRVCELCLGKVPWRGVVYRCYRGSLPGSAALGTSLTAHRALRSFDRVTRFLAVSRFVRDKYIEGGVSADRIVVKPNFAWPAGRRQGPGDYFLYLGRLDPEKGVETVVRAAPGLSARVLIVGGGSQAESLRRDAPPNVEFTGPVDPSRVPSILGRARALLVPSLWFEAAPRGITEAFASGVPVIASRLGALPEAVEEGVSGTLVEPGRPQDLARAMRDLQDDRRSERLGEGAYRIWESHYSPQSGLQDLEEAYREALASTGRAPGD